MQVSVDINDSFAKKCCATTQMKALLYIYRLRMINMLFVEQINFFSKIFPDVSSSWWRLSITCHAANTDMQIWDEPWRLQTPPHDDSQGRTDMKTGENRGKELNNICMNVSSTCPQKPERQCSTMIYYQRNSQLQRQKENYFSTHYFTSQNQGLSGLKNFGLVIMTADQLSVIFSPARDDWDD